MQVDQSYFFIPFCFSLKTYIAILKQISLSRYFDSWTQPLSLSRNFGGFMLYSSSVPNVVHCMIFVLTCIHWNSSLGAKLPYRFILAVQIMAPNRAYNILERRGHGRVYSAPATIRGMYAQSGDLEHATAQRRVICKPGSA